MQDIVEPTIARKINDFLTRKSFEFPELHLKGRWNEYEYTPKRKVFGRTRKHAIAR